MGLLQDKIAIITGGGSGIGQSIAQAFAGEGAKVVLASRNRQNLEAVAQQIEQAGGTALVVPTDVTAEDQVVGLFQQALEAFDRIDILVNNAGVMTGGPTDELTLAQWQSVLDVNLTGPFLCSREALKVMKKQKSGRIINIGSVAAHVARPDTAPYATTKSGLDGLTRSLALDGRAHGVAVSVLHPGNTATNIWGGPSEVHQREGAMPPEDLARVAVTMASLPDDINVLESIVLPLSMPYLGRG